ncbi:homogentisate 1,2-dioxygenase [Sphingobium phenoxybenzoativorans]|uniref:homogentisate 1,2-dioxygenase n=1 Tax=Sphingobium phenoxybenzoativorans TaxID=1592790 RepID=UPI001FE8E2A5|nr:homogentisate 1,2-dioxygenase [Sphingobium phenoxybenzoativorans]
MPRKFLIALAFAATPLHAQIMDQADHAHAAQCAQSAALPPEFTGWAQPVSIDAASNAKGLAAAEINIGQAARANLRNTPEISYLTRPEKPGGSVSHGGLFRFTVKEAGTYRVALGSGAWIDVLEGKSAIQSTAHGHGPECSGIRKMVDFPLKPGRHVLQIAANGDAALPLMIIRMP